MFDKGIMSSTWQMDPETGLDYLLVEYKISKIILFHDDTYTLDSSEIAEKMRKDILKDMDVPDVCYICNREDPNCEGLSCSKHGGPCEHTHDIRHAVNFEKLDGSANTYVETYDKVYPNVGNKKCSDCGEPLHDLVVSHNGEEVDIHVAYESNPRNNSFYFCPKCHKVYVFES